jgi:uncharacterized RDD family membrane protein YckC
MDEKIHVSRNRDSLGVFTEEQLKMALGRGSVYAGDFCWKAGMKEWVTISQAYPHLIPATPTARQSHPPFPSSGASPQPPVDNSLPPAPLAPAGSVQSTVGLPTGGDRFCAYLLDSLFMMLLCCLFMVPAIVFLAVISEAGSMRSSVMQSYVQLLTYGCGFFGPLLYYGIMGNTSQNATWGQRIMGFKMVDARTGAAPDSGQVWKWALYRGLITSCCGCIGLLFFIPILNDARKQSAFDSWADILMVRR